MSESTVSVLVPAFNRKKYIIPCLKSILAQSYNDIVIIVYDDGSTDETVDTVKTLGVSSNKLKVIEGKHVGVAAARNRLLDSVSTKYACWQDSDDVSNPFRIEFQMALLKESSSRCVMTLCQWLHRVNEQVRVEKPEEVKTFRPGFATALFLVDSVPRFNEGITMGGEDRAWRTRLELTEGVGQFPFVPRVLYYVRKHADRIGNLKTCDKYKKEVTESNRYRHEEYMSMDREFKRSGGSRD